MILCKVEEEYTSYAMKRANIDNLIDKLLLVIEHDNFNCAQAYNYCRSLKELLIKKKEYTALKSKYKGIIRYYNSRWLNIQLEKEKKKLNSRKYTGKIFSQDEEIIKIIDEKL
jgi:hypothetical protein